MLSLFTTLQTGSIFSMQTMFEHLLERFTKPTALTALQDPAAGDDREGADMKVEDAEA